MLFDSLYWLLNGKEIHKASTILKRIRIETIFQRLSKLCWNYNIQCETIIKTNNLLILRLIGPKETILFKYHKAEVILRCEIDIFLNEIDENYATRGYYISTGIFEKYGNESIQNLFRKKDLITESGKAFITNNLRGFGKAGENFTLNRINFIKYLPK